jgi:hypothetical protein
MVTVARAIRVAMIRAWDWDTWSIWIVAHSSATVVEDATWEKISLERD